MNSYELISDFNQSFNTIDKIKNIWFNAWCKNIFDYMEHLIEHNVEFMVSIGNIFFILLKQLLIN